MVGHRQQRVGVRRQIDAHDIRFLVHDVIDEARVLMRETVVILTPDGRGDHGQDGAAQSQLGQFRGDSEGTRSYTKRAVFSLEDWSKLSVLDADSPHLAAQLKCLAILRSELGSDVPLIQTVF